MTQTIQAPLDHTTSEPIPSHPHFTLASMTAIGLIGALVALAIAIAGLMITAGRNSVDDSLVAQKVDAALAEATPPATSGATADPTASVIPAFVPKAELAAAPAGEVNVATAPQIPPASGRTEPAIVEVEFVVVEGVTSIDPETGVESETWGFKVAGDSNVVSGTPGPVIRARVGDILRLTITNPASSIHPHNIDLHAVSGPGGGAAATTVAPGESKTIEARMLYPGFFMYHCAYGDVPAHIAHGMYGGILVDPETPLPAVDHEWYIVQSEFYTTSTEPGVVDFDRQALTDENPTYVVFNGAKGAVAGDNALQMAVGERARIYFIDAGPDLDSNFHPIGSHWDAVYPEAALLNQPLRGSQTTLVPAGGGVVVDIIGQVPATIILVDHAISRAFDKGAIGQIVVSGDEQPEIFEVINPTPSGEQSQPSSDQTAVPGASVSILPNAFQAQPMDATDEFADLENPADYSINTLTVSAGTTVTWTNDDPGMLHTITAVDGSFDSGFLNDGDTWSYTFAEPGEFEYFCTPHPWMRAKVIVEG